MILSFFEPLFVPFYPPTNRLRLFYFTFFFHSPPLLVCHFSLSFLFYYPFTFLTSFGQLAFLPACCCCASSLSSLRNCLCQFCQCVLDWACVASGKANTIPPEPYTERESTPWVLVCTPLSADLVLSPFYPLYFPRCRVETINPPAVSPLSCGDHGFGHCVKAWTLKSPTPSCGQ
jgi:hypothetical protein